MKQPTLSRKDLLRAAAALGASITLPGSARALAAQDAVHEVTLEELRSAQKLAGLNFTDDQLRVLVDDVGEWLKGYRSLRSLEIANEVPLPVLFQPVAPRGLRVKGGVSAKSTPPRRPAVPVAEEDLAFMTLGELSHLLRTRRVSSRQLTQLFLSRLELYGHKLQAIVNLLPEAALAAADRADNEIRNGHHRGPLHGVPTGIKDLFAMRGAPTTWGAAPYKEQVLAFDAAVVERLERAGAVICAKLTLGTLAMGDKWFGGQTKSPWDPSKGSSGSSAGSAACVAAGLLPYAIGTETLGSIVSPSHQCRVTGLRPSFGRVSRFGAMTLCWSMDKVGVVARCAEDTALVLAALAGADPRDRTTRDLPFHYAARNDLKGLKIGYLLPARPGASPSSALRQEVSDLTERLGAGIESISIEVAPEGLLTILEVEAAAAFDDLTRSGRLSELTESAWPEIFRASRFVPGVELLRAYRARQILMERFERELSDFDLFVAEGRGMHTLLITNLSGHPQILLPFGTDENAASRSISLVGRLYEEDTLIAVAQALQRLTTYHTRRPDLSKL